MIRILACPPKTDICASKGYAVAAKSPWYLGKKWYRTKHFDKIRAEWYRDSLGNADARSDMRISLWSGLVEDVSIECGKLRAY